MTHHHMIAVGIGLVMGALVGAGFGVVLAQRDSDTSPLLGTHQPPVGGIVMGLAVAVLFAGARIGPHSTKTRPKQTDNRR
jgi:hypothetical protein